MTVINPSIKDNEIFDLKEKIRKIREAVEDVVVTKGEDKGVVLMSIASPTVYNEELKCQVYIHDNFSPLGDALVKIHEMCKE